MRIGIPRQPAPGERRVPIVPETIKRLVPKNIEFVVQAGAGERAFYADSDYRSAGATIVSSLEDVVAASETIVQIQKPDADRVQQMREGTALVCLLYPLVSLPLIRSLSARKMTAIALDSVPRTTLAQSMDVLSSQASVAGYWAVVAAAHRLPRFFPMMMTPAGTVTPARALVLGAGVAGLQAIATARRLGAVVEAFDVRKAVKEQVESLGARFVEVDSAVDASGEGGYAKETSEEYQRRQRALIHQRLAKSDIAITTALVPGQRAPILITREMIEGMRPGSVIVDLAAEQGGNTEGCVPGEEVVINGVTIVGPLNAPSALAVHASQMFSRNIEKLLLHTTADGAWKLNPDDEIVRGCLVVRDGRVLDPKVKDALAREEVAL